MPDSPPLDARGLEELEEEWRRNPRTPAFYALATRYFEVGRTQDAYDVLCRGLKVHRAHADAKTLLERVQAALDNVRGSRPGHRPLGRVSLKSGRSSVEERVSERVAAGREAPHTPTKVARHKPPPEDPFATDPGEFPPPAATPPIRIAPDSLRVARGRVAGATTVAPRRGLAIAAILLVLIGAAIAAYLIFQPI